MLLNYHKTLNQHFRYTLYTDLAIHGTRKDILYVIYLLKFFGLL